MVELVGIDGLRILHAECVALARDLSLGPASRNPPPEARMQTLAGPIPYRGEMLSRVLLRFMLLADIFTAAGLVCLAASRLPNSTSATASSADEISGRCLLDESAPHKKQRLPE
jgi:hypothetical protein